METAETKAARKFGKIANILFLILLLFFGIVTSLVATTWAISGEKILSLFIVLMGLFIVLVSLRGIIVNVKQLLGKRSDKYVPLTNGFYIGLVSFGVMFTLLGIYLFYDDVFNKQWQPLTALVEESELKIEKTSWTPTVSYSYVFDGEKYSGTLQSSGGINDIAEAQKFVAKHPAGSYIPIKINVKNPSESKLDQGIIVDYMQGLAGIAGGLIFFFVGIFLDRTHKDNQL